MTVRELIAALAALDTALDDLPVVTEGCDCDGGAEAVLVREGYSGGYVYLTRYGRDLVVAEGQHEAT